MILFLFESEITFLLYRQYFEDFVADRNNRFYYPPKSTMPPTGVAITGIQAIASIKELPIPSDKEGRIKISQAFKYFGIFREKQNP